MTEGRTSIVTDWDLVCEDNYFAEISSMIFISGIPVGSIIFTPIADRFGRKWVVLIAGLSYGGNDQVSKKTI